MLKKIGTIPGYRIAVTSHGAMRMRQRRIDKYLVISAIASIGDEKLKHYNNKGIDVCVHDEKNNFLVVFCMQNYVIKVITVIKNADFYTKSHSNIHLIINGNGGDINGQGGE